MHFQVRLSHVLVHTRNEIRMNEPLALGIPHKLCNNSRSRKKMIEDRLVFSRKIQDQELQPLPIRIGE